MVNSDVYCLWCEAPNFSRCAKEDKCERNPDYKCPRYIAQDTFLGLCSNCGESRNEVRRREMDKAHEKRHARAKNHPCNGCVHLDNIDLQGPFESLKVTVPYCKLTVNPHAYWHPNHNTFTYQMAFAKCDDFEEKKKDAIV